MQRFAQEEGDNSSACNSGTTIKLQYEKWHADFLPSLRRVLILAETILLCLLSPSRALTPLPSSAPLSLIKQARRSVWLV